MYAALWRALRGPWWAKLGQTLVLAALVVAILFTWVFPIVLSLLPDEEVTVPDGPAPSVTSSSTPSQGG